MPDGEVLLEIKGLSKSFGGVTAVDGFTAGVRQNQVVGIIGPNGAGKTTILNLISGIYRADAGEALFGGRNIVGLKPYEVARLGIARTFQNIRLFQDMDVLNTVRTAYSWRAEYGLLKAMVGWKDVRTFEDDVEDKVLACLDRVGLYACRHEYAASLPYGLQRRVELARALAGEPKLLLLDEPGAGLNHAEVKDLIELIERLFRDLNLSIILIDHRIELIMRLCHWIYVQDFGRTIAQGQPEAIQKDPVVIKAYLGEEFD